MSPYAGHPACAEYSGNNKDCLTKGDGISKVVGEGNVGVDLDREEALDQGEAWISRRLGVVQAAQSQQRRADTILVREL